MGITSRIATLLAVSAFFEPGPATAQTAASHSLYGSAGLIDMPVASVFPDGEISWTLGILPGTNRGSMNFQALPRLEGTVRYSTIDGLDADGSSSFDMSFDLKYQLADEDGWRPAIAIGFRDFLGDGVYSSEYLVATKTMIGGMTLTGGIGWGRLGSYGGFDNPFGLDDRPDERENGGQFGANQWFRGDAAFFGGFEWQTPFRGLSMKAEYSSDAYEAETAGGTFNWTSPWSLGIEYAPWSGVQLGAYLVNGDNVGFQLTLGGNPNNPITNPDAGVGPPPVMIRPAGGDRNPAWAGNDRVRDQIMKAVTEALAHEGVSVQSALLRPRVAEIRISNTRWVLNSRAVGRTARIMALAMPHSVEQFRITLVQDGLPVSTTVIDRSDYEAQIDRPNAGAESWASSQVIDATPVLEGGNLWTRDDFPNFSWTINPSVPIEFFKPDQPVTYDLLINFGAWVQLSRTLALAGNISQHVLGSTDESAFGSEFDKTSRPILTWLKLEKDYKLTDNIYTRTAVGWLEKKYGGIGTQVLWQPVDQNWGLGGNIAYVWQRDPDSYTAFDDYQTVTGFGSAYWDTGYHDVTAQLDLGRYLAGDWGGTLTLGRRFNNGWEVDLYLTMTDASYDEFGEGAFDKGVSVSIPLRWTLPYETRSSTTINFGTGNRQYGSRLGGTGTLYEDVRDYSRQRMYETWGAFWQ